MDDLEAYSKDEELVARVERNTQQYLQLCAEAADRNMPPPTLPDLPEDVFDVLLEQVGAIKQRRRRAGGRAPGGGRHVRVGAALRLPTPPPPCTLSCPPPTHPRPSSASARRS